MSSSSFEEQWKKRATIRWILMIRVTSLPNWWFLRQTFHMIQVIIDLNWNYYLTWIKLLTLSSMGHYKVLVFGQVYIRYICGQTQFCCNVMSVIKMLFWIVVEHPIVTKLKTSHFSGECLFLQEINFFLWCIVTWKCEYAIMIYYSVFILP